MDKIKHKNFVESPEGKTQLRKSRRRREEIKRQAVYVLASKSIKYYVFWLCVFFLALVVQHAMRMRRIVTWLVRLYSIFFPLSSKKHDFRKEMIRLDVRGSVHHSTIHKEKSNKMQQCIKILLFHIYLKLNMFRVTHRPSSGV